MHLSYTRRTALTEGNARAQPELDTFPIGNSNQKNKIKNKKGYVNPVTVTITIAVVTVTNPHASQASIFNPPDHMSIARLDGNEDYNGLTVH